MPLIPATNAVPPVHRADKPGAIQTHSIAEILDVLFTWERGDDTATQEAAFMQLEASANGANLDSIDVLMNLALRTDEWGKRAERSLFAVFSSPSLGQGIAADHIGKAALALHDLYDRNPAKFDSAKAKLTSPSLLLYMAGAAADIGLQNQLSHSIFSQNARATDPREQVGEFNVWGDNRFVTHDELACVTRSANQQASDVERFNSPMPLMMDGGNYTASMLSEMVSLQHGPNWPQFIPVNTGGHWVLLGIHQPPGAGTPEAFVFSSTPLTDEATRAALVHAADVAGADSVCFMDQDLQQHVPNGCGLFVAHAMSSLAASSGSDPQAIIRTLQQDAGRMSLADCEDYNRCGRRQLYGNFLDSHATLAP